MKIVHASCMRMVEEEDYSRRLFHKSENASNVGGGDARLPLG